MKSQTLGAAVITGYVLGRLHKVKWALALAAIAGGRQLAGKQGGVLGKASQLADSGGVGKLSGDVRGKLVEAGKAAAATAVSRRIDALSDSLHERGESLRGGNHGSGEDEEPGDEEPGDEEEPDEPRSGAEDSQEGRSRQESRRPARREGSGRPPGRRRGDGERPARRRAADPAASERPARGRGRGGSQ